jgi:hypothetical protein
VKLKICGDILEIHGTNLLVWEYGSNIVVLHTVIKISSWCHCVIEWNWIGVTSGSPLEVTQPQLVGTSMREHKWFTRAARLNLTRFSQLQLNLNTLWCWKWCQLPGIAISTSVQSKCCCRLCMLKCDVGFQF